MAVVLVLAGASLLQSSPALAISQRGHEFSFRFGAFSDPDGLAVDDATGVVYVADGKQKRVQAFEPRVSGGEIVGEVDAQSWEEASIASPEALAVDNSGDSLDPSDGDVYVVSAAKAIYKLDGEGHELEKIKGFQTGAAKEKKFSEIEGVAVDPKGDLFVYQHDGVIYEFNDEVAVQGVGQQTAPPERRTGENEGHPAFAVDAEGDFYIGDQGEAGASELQAELLREVSEGYAETRTPNDEESSFGVVAKLDGATNGILTPALDYEFTSAVAVNPLDEPHNAVSERDDVYVVNVTGSGAERTSTVAQFGPEEGAREKGSVIQRFGTSGLGNGDAIAVDAKTGVVFVADAATAADDVDVFQLEKPGPPTVERTSAESSASQGYSETLSAEVDPSGADTDFYFEYGTSPCRESACTQSAPSNAGEGFGDDAASLTLSGLNPATYYYRVVAVNGNGVVRGEEHTFTVIAAIGGLPDGRGWELVSSPNTAGAEPEPLTREGGAIQASQNGDAITYVASGPIPATRDAQGNRDPEYPQTISTRGEKGWESEDITTPVTEGTGVEVGVAPEYQIFSPNLALALVQPAVGAPRSGATADPPLAPTETDEKTIYLRDDQPLDGEEVAPLAPGASEVEAYEAARANAAQAGDVSPGYVALVTALQPPGGGDPEFGGGLGEGVEFVNANESLSDVVLKSWTDHPGLYEWEGVGRPLKEVSVLPGPGETLDEPNQAFLGGLGGADSRHAVSSDGARVVWTAHGNGGNDLFVRDTKTGNEETVQLDAYQGVPVEEKAPAAIFQTANASDSKVFFTDTRRLTPESRATEESPDLYVAELHGGEAPGEPLSATLRDLTPQEGAKVLALGEGGAGGGVLGAGEEADGALNVYFVADGALAPGAATSYCRTEAGPVPTGTTCNLFVKHYSGSEWDATRFIAALSAEDQPDWRSTAAHDNLTELTSRVSPNGDYLAFMSNRSLTGYDNEDLSSERAKEPRLDEEVYLYEAASGLIMCASCNPSGMRPTGVLAQPDAGEGLGLLVSRPQTWEAANVEHWLAGSVPGWTSLSNKTAIYQSRYLSNEGRLFFDSADPLVPLAKPTRQEQVGETTEEVGVENVYEYERDGLGGCRSAAGCVALVSSGTSEHESAFLDASESGNDVFFLTAASVTSQDLEGNHIYDAHVCGQGLAEACHAPPVAGANGCEKEGGEACHPGSGSPPSFAASATETFSGPGNLVARVQVLGEREAAKPKPLTRAQKLAKALKLCARERQKAKRLSCEREARKRYGPRKLKSKSTSKSTRTTAGMSAEVNGR
jgi:hypothetical protein